MNQDIQVRNNEAQREARKRDKMERDLTQAKAELDARNSDIKNTQAQIDRYKAEKDKLDQQLREQRVRERYKKKKKNNTEQDRISRACFTDISAKEAQKRYSFEITTKLINYCKNQLQLLIFSELQFFIYRSIHYCMGRILIKRVPVSTAVASCRLSISNNGKKLTWPIAFCEKVICMRTEKLSIYM